jgi:hypothetical protein
VRPNAELTGQRRMDAWPRLAKMYHVPPDRAWWTAVALRLSEGLGIIVPLLEERFQGHYAFAIPALDIEFILFVT